jgi:hypothetical protein
MTLVPRYFASLRNGNGSSLSDFPKEIPHLREVFFLEGPLGFEPRTRGLKVPCSNQLSYGPICSGFQLLYISSANFRSTLNVL